MHAQRGLREQHADGEGVEQGTRRLQRLLTQDLDRQEKTDDAAGKDHRRQAQVEVIDRGVKQEGDDVGGDVQGEACATVSG